MIKIGMMIGGRYELLEEDGIFYIVMELVEGITLKNYIGRKGRLSVKEAVKLIMDLKQFLVSLDGDFVK